MSNFTTFLGVKMSQASYIIPFWEKILFENDFRRIVEFGTYKGGLSLFFLLWCMQRKSAFYTYDNMAHKYSRLGYGLKLPQHFKKIDIFKHEKEIGEIIQRPGRTIVFCDNGDKPRELKIFSKYLKPGDIIGVHDFNTEVMENDIPSDLTIIGIETGEPKGEPKTLILRKDE